MDDNFIQFEGSNDRVRGNCQRHLYPAHDRWSPQSRKSLELERWLNLITPYRLSSDIELFPWAFQINSL